LGFVVVVVVAADNDFSTVLKGSEM